MASRDAHEHLELAASKLDEMRRRAKHGPSRFWTLDGMIEAWRELVGQIESGYDEMVEEYWNDLGVRDLLEELIGVLPKGSVRSRVVQEVEDVDSRYREVTHEVDEPIFGSGEMPWWWWRVPNVLVGELRRGLT